MLSKDLETAMTHVRYCLTITPDDKTFKKQLIDVVNFIVRDHICKIKRHYNTISISFDNISRRFI